MDNSPSIPGNSSEASHSQSDADAGNALHLYPTLPRESTSSIATVTPKTDSWPSKSSSQNPAPSAPTSAAPSPLPSREPSPTRPLSRTANSRGSSATPGNRSRKNSLHDTSPSRLTRPNNTATSSTSRTLSSSNTPTLLPFGYCLFSKGMPGVGGGRVARVVERTRIPQQQQLMQGGRDPPYDQCLTAQKGALSGIWMCLIGSQGALW